MNLFWCAYSQTPYCTQSWQGHLIVNSHGYPTQVLGALLTQDCLVTSQSQNPGKAELMKMETFF